jgi:crossover junction endodeoxyribonuclease RuvC
MMEKSPVTGICSVGLDLSLTGTGFTLKQGKEYKLELIKTSPKTAENDLARIIYIRDRIMKMIPEYVHIVAVEDFYIPQSKLQFNSCISLVKLGTAVRMALYERGLPMVIISPTSLKKFGTGKGNGPKGVVLREVYRQWGIEAMNDDNVADSVVLSHMGEAMVNTMRKNDLSHLLKYQVEAIERVIAERPCYNLK